MEVIQIPEVGLVNASGQYIGVFEDKPDWWDKVQHELNKKRRVAAIHQSNSQYSNTQVHEKDAVGDKNKADNAMIVRRPGLTAMSASNSSLRLIGHETTQETILDDDGGVSGGLTDRVDGIHHNNIFKQLGSSYSLRHGGDGTHYADFDFPMMECNLIGETYMHLAIMYDSLDTVKVSLVCSDFWYS
jgi:hypothetical protein